MFDGTLKLTTLEKLTRLKTLADKATGDQNSFCSCLYHDAATDEILRESGLPSRPYFSRYPNVSKQDSFILSRISANNAAWQKLDDWLGLDPKDTAKIFGSNSIRTKRSHINKLIKRLR